MMHTPVLLKEVIQYLDPKPGDMIVDATLGGGGHAMALAEKIAPDGKVLGIERDKELLEETRAKIEKSGLKDNFILVNESYVNIANIVRENNFRPNGVLFDLGLSSWHYEKSGRGFSFKRDEALDMRFNMESSLTAAKVVNTYSEANLKEIFREYGEEQFSGQIAKNIISARRREPILRTSGLVEVIGLSVPHWYKKRKIHFATKTFQALRIEVNSELKNVEKGISAAIEVLEPARSEQFVPELTAEGLGRRGGRLAVISFQGLEDKIVREIFKKKAKEGVIRWIVKGTVKPKWEEIKNNPRARSAKLKIAEKL